MPHSITYQVSTLSLTAVLTSNQCIEPHSSTHQQSVRWASQQYSPAVSTLSLTAVLTSSQYVEPHSSTPQQSGHWASQQYSPALRTLSLPAVLHQQSVRWASQQYSPAVSTLNLTAILTSSQYIQPHSSAHLEWELSWRCVCAIHYSNVWRRSFNKNRNILFLISGSIFEAFLTQSVVSVSFTIAAVQTATRRNNVECNYNCNSWNVDPSQTVLTDTVNLSQYCVYGICYWI